jgi:hypothetical protein
VHAAFGVNQCFDFDQGGSFAFGTVQLRAAALGRQNPGFHHNYDLPFQVLFDHLRNSGPPALTGVNLYYQFKRGLDALTR